MKVQQQKSTFVVLPSRIQVPALPAESVSIDVTPEIPFLVWTEPKRYSMYTAV